MNSNIIPNIDMSYLSCRKCSYCLNNCIISNWRIIAYMYSIEISPDNNIIPNWGERVNGYFSCEGRGLWNVIGTFEVGREVVEGDGLSVLGVVFNVFDVFDATGHVCVGRGGCEDGSGEFGRGFVGALEEGGEELFA